MLPALSGWSVLKGLPQQGVLRQRRREQSGVRMVPLTQLQPIQRQAEGICGHWQGLLLTCGVIPRVLAWGRGELQHDGHGVLCRKRFRTCHPQTHCFGVLVILWGRYLRNSSCRRGPCLPPSHLKAGLKFPLRTALTQQQEERTVLSPEMGGRVGTGLDRQTHWDDAHLPLVSLDVSSLCCHLSS